MKQTKKEIIHQAFITGSEVTIIMTSGRVFEHKQIADYSVFGVLTTDRLYIVWGGICTVIIWS
ncbi:MAG: hypothetical protein IKE91_01420 [Clostridia bacterium]|nr:hypothetical protein [Clostridia bacterium]